ncbi:MAG TPA: NAD(P)-dependent oxidoreductase [Ktedonobacteraceae bacterium]|nr:NAD(P)-dependent oxidoreductase [Ktedonobacteraceae bacterium]
MSQHLGFIGLGNMGSPMASNLIKAGYRLSVYNRSADKARALVEAGAHQVNTPGEVAEAGGIVITMLANDEAVKSVTLGQNGILDRLGPGGIHISMSTISPALSREMVALHQQHQCTYIAAPVFGRPEAAAAHKLWVCVAGETAAKERVHPVLEALGQGLFDYGAEPEKANIVKICGNFMIAAAMETMGEALALAEKNGISRTEMIDMFGQTLFACAIYQNYGKMIAERSFTPVGFQMQLALKDINLVLDKAEESRAPMPFASLLHDRFLRGVANGQGEADWASLTNLISDDAGIQK